MDFPYFRYSQYLIEKYGEKVYKIPINIPSYCPNRDGTKGYGGCIFCAEDGSGHENMAQHIDIAVQYDAMKQILQKKYRVQKYIAFLQSFSNTYLPFDDFKKYLTQMAKLKDCVGIAISTRPDCIEERHLDFLTTLKAQYGLDISVEIGLQSANDETLCILNRGHTTEDVVQSARKIKAAGLELCLHVIVNLPWDSNEDVIKTGKMITALRADSAKIHTLYVAKGTVLEKMYHEKTLKMLSLEETITRTILLLEYIDPTVAMQRIVSRVTEEKSVFCNWNQSWRKVLMQIEEQMRCEGTRQGRCLTKI